MNEEELKLYDILFPNDNDPTYINYGYFTGGSLRKLSVLKSKIRNSCIDPIIIEDDTHEGSFFIKIQQKDVDIFLSTIEPLKYRERKIPKRFMNKIRILFGDSNQSY